MYIIERSIGVITFSLGIILFLSLLKRIKIGQETFVIKGYYIFLIILAYFYIPGIHADLNRYIEYSIYYNSLSLDNFIDLVQKSSAPVNIIYFYLIGKTGNINLISTITCIIFYGISFKILMDSFKEFKFSKTEMANTILLFMSTGVFLSVISIIRSYLALGIVSACIYYEIISKRSLIKDLPFYILSILIHPAAFMILVYRIIFEIFVSEKDKYFKFFHKIFFGLLIIIIIVLSKGYITDIIFEKASYYLESEVYIYIWEYLINLIYIFYSSYIVYKNNSNKFTYKRHKEVKRLGKFILITNIILTFFIFEYSIFVRYQVVSSILFLPYFAISQKYGYKINKNILYIIAILILIIACTRGNLSGYKYMLFEIY